MTLKEAQQQGKIEEFIKEHENDNQGDMELFYRAISSLAQTSKSTQETSSQDSSEH